MRVVRLSCESWPERAVTRCYAVTPPGNLVFLVGPDTFGVYQLSIVVIVVIVVVDIGESRGLFFQTADNVSICWQPQVANHLWSVSDPFTRRIYKLQTSS